MVLSYFFQMDFDTTSQRTRTDQQKARFLMSDRMSQYMPIKMSTWIPENTSCNVSISVKMFDRLWEYISDRLTECQIKCKDVLYIIIYTRHDICPGCARCGFDTPHSNSVTFPAARWSGWGRFSMSGLRWHNKMLMRSAVGRTLPGLVNIQKAMENGHRKSGFTH